MQFFSLLFIEYRRRICWNPLASLVFYLPRAIRQWETVTHGTWIILFLTRHNEPINDDQQTIFTHQLSAWFTLLMFYWWFYNWQCNASWDLAIDLLHKSHNAPVPYPTMHHFVTETCTHVHLSVTKWCIVGYLSGALWDLWDASIVMQAHEVKADALDIDLIQNDIHDQLCKKIWYDRQYAR